MSVVSAASATIEREIRYGLELTPRRRLVIVEGRGATVVDEDGRSYIDCVAGHGVALIGHCNPEVVEAIRRQAERLISCPISLYSDVRAELLEELVRIAPAGLDRAFLCNSGTEAVEAALKFSRTTTGRTEVVAARGSFHGRTMGALSATFEPHYREPFGPLLPGFEFVPFNDLDRLSAAVGERTAAVILEPVQGEGGVHPARADYLKGARELCDANGALLILDEVQTGLGRTGRMFACEHSSVTPDLLCLAKGLAGGVPMGAVLCSERITVPSGGHGTTYGGNPLACAASLATLRFIVSNGLPEQAARKGSRLIERLRSLELSQVREVRGLGLMVGIALKSKVRPFLERLAERGVLALPAGLAVLRLLPPLVITDEQLDRVVEALAEVLSARS
jgi:acetylornithine/LysW-gamma-L-lysine aminotransferase